MNKKIVSLLLTMFILIALVSGCGSKSSSKDNSDNKKLTVTDMAGRKVTIKGTPKTAIALYGAQRFYCYVGDLKKLVGIEQNDISFTKGKAYIMANPSLAKLPIVGQDFSKPYDPEKILAVKPDVIFTIVSDKAQIDNLQSKTGIPVIALSYGKSAVFDPDVYSSLKLIGKVMDEDKRAKEVVEYMEKCKKDLNDRTKDIPDSKKSKVYAGSITWYGGRGIESTQENYPLFNAINAKNVVEGTGKTDPVCIDKEKIVQWNPEKIFIDMPGLKVLQDDYKKNPDFYKGLAAFKNGEVYSQLPYVAYWYNVEVAISDAYYIGKVVYPDKFNDIDPEKKANEIYKSLLGKELYSQLANDYGSGFGKITLH